MKRRESSSDPRAELRSACLRLIAAATQIAIEKTGSAAIPESTITVRYLAAAEPGRHSGKEYQVKEPDISGLLFDTRKSLQEQPSWQDAEAAVDRYIKARGVKPGAFMIHDIASHFLWPLLALYWERKGDFALSNSHARECVTALLRHLDAPATRVKALIALEGFVADHAFLLENGVHIHPIRVDEIRILGREDFFTS